VVVGRSTGGQIALELARRYPDLVRALVLLEPALFTADPQADAWARQLRLDVLQAVAERSSPAEAVLRVALGDEAWESLPETLRQLFDEASPAVLAEIRGRGLDLSAEPLQLSAEELGGIRLPTMLVSAEDSPEPLRRVNDQLARLLPLAEHVLVTGGHLINPAHPFVLGFIDRILASGASV
jgi:pimeloyl-ACP methyl ester carboxylesterase